MASSSSCLQAREGGNLEEEEDAIQDLSSMTRGVEESPGKRTESLLSWCLHCSNIFSCRVMVSSPTYYLCFSRNSTTQGVRGL